MGHDTRTPLLSSQQRDSDSAPSAPLGSGPDLSYPHIGTGVFTGKPYEPAGEATGIPVGRPQPLEVPPASYQHPHFIHTPNPATTESHTVIHVTEGPLITRVSSVPALGSCPACHCQAATMVDREAGCCTWLSAAAMFWVCCPLFWLPFCLDCDKDLVHRCGVCGAEIARVKPL